MNKLFLAFAAVVILGGPLLAVHYVGYTASVFGYLILGLICFFIDLNNGHAHGKDFFKDLFLGHLSFVSAIYRLIFPPAIKG